MPPAKILLISGKRKCGKDYIAERLQKSIGDAAEIVRISEPIKAAFAKSMNLSLPELLSEGAYKEQYRKQMIIWSEQVRVKDYGYFCRSAMEKARKNIIIVSDIRRKSDIKYFQETYGTSALLIVRISCPLEERQTRGWLHTPGVDDAPSECDCDDYKGFALEFENKTAADGERIVAALSELLLPNKVTNDL